jgi:hypothetical protein
MKNEGAKITKTITEITAMQQAYFDLGREDAFAEMENMAFLVAHKLDQRRNHWKQRVAAGMEADVLLLYTTIQYDFYIKNIFVWVVLFSLLQL